MRNFNFDPFPELHTPRLRLREVRGEDAAAIQQLRNHPLVKEFLGRVGPETMEAALEKIELFLSNAASGKAIFWVICLRDDPRVLGTICLWNLEPDNQRGELGYEMHPDHQGNGYMREAMQAAMDYGFGKMELHTVCAFTDAENIPSIRLLEQGGFEKEAHFRESTYYGGRYHDMVVYTRINR